MRTEAREVDEIALCNMRCGQRGRDRIVIIRRPVLQLQRLLRPCAVG